MTEKRRSPHKAGNVAQAVAAGEKPAAPRKRAAAKPRSKPAEAVVSAQVAGLRLVDVFAGVGDRVKRGQLLARFDADLLRADETRLKAASEQAEFNRQRALQLKGSGGISDQDVLQYVTQAEMANAQVQTNRLQIRYAEVVAPDDGVISARNATLGTVSASGQELFRLIRQNRLEWRGEVTAAQVASIKPGQRVHLALPDGQAAAAKVRQMAPGFDPQTRLGTVYADLESGGSARAGMYAKGRIVLGESQAITVPETSVIVRDGRNYVLKLGDGDRVKLQQVNTGRRRDHAVEVVSGVKAGERVAVQGAGFLNDGDVVHVVASAKE